MTTLERLVERLFDYAGMFPPAALEFQAALTESAALPRTLARPHLVGADLVVRREYLALVNDDTLRAAGFEEGRHIQVCLVGVPLKESTDALDRIRAFHAEAREARIPRRVAALEVTDDDPLEDPETTERRLRQLSLVATGNGIAVYHEPRWSDTDWARRLAALLALLDNVRRDGRTPIGLKVRCAGPTALSPRTLAQVLAAVADLRLPLKATQGLHHPIVEPDPHDSSIGFLGLLMAHRLRIGRGEAVPIDDIERCLVERDPGAFLFGADEAGWGDHRLSGDALARARVSPFHIGSCSLAEPDQDLVRLFGPPAVGVVRRQPHNA